MVNDAATLGIDPADSDPLRALALGYASAAARPGVMALFALDAALAGIVRRARDPLAAQLKLAWWDEALRALDAAPPPAQPVLAALAAHVLPIGVTGAALARQIDGWEALLVSPPDIASYATARGTVFENAAVAAGATVPAGAGEAWALADLGRILPDRAATGRALAAVPLAEAAKVLWPREARFLGALIHAARREPSARSVARLLVHRLTGR